jgi:hypothetical protein
MKGPLRKGNLGLQLGTAFAQSGPGKEGHDRDGLDRGLCLWPPDHSTLHD